jgi:prepilin-type processing-associated H-X9-DG protein
MPAVFHVPEQRPGATDTYYQGFTGRGTIFERGQRIGFPQITDGSSNTLLVVEAGPPVAWTKPVDLPYSANKPLPKMDGPFADRLNVCFADGSASALKRPVEGPIFRAAITRDGGEVVDLDLLRMPEPPKPPRGQLGDVPLLEKAARTEAEAQRDAAILAEAERLRAEQERNQRSGADMDQIKRELATLREQVRLLQQEVERLKRERRQ